MTHLPQAVMKEAVKTYWEVQPCGTSAGVSAVHTQAWFDEIEQSRYDREPFIHSFAQFPRWRGKWVLEIGCGAGTDSVQFARAGAQLHAVDLTEAGVELTNRRILQEGLSADVRVGDAEQLPFPDNEFDLVYSWGVLHHTPNTEAALAQVRRVLKPAGRFVIMLYNRHSLVAYRMWIARALLAGKPFQSLTRVLAEHVESTGTKAYTISELKRMFSQFEAVIIQSVMTPYDVSYLPGWMHLWLPPRLGWFTVITGSKPSGAAPAVPPRIATLTY